MKKDQQKNPRKQESAQKTKERSKVSSIVEEILEEASENNPSSIESKNEDTVITTLEVVVEKDSSFESQNDEPIINEDKDQPDSGLSFYEKVMGEKPSEKIETDQASNERRLDAKLFLLGAFVFVLTIVIASGIGFYILNKDGFINQFSSKKVEPTTAKSSPTPIPEKFAREEWKFEVLNGSETPGLAAKGAEKIKALGYTVSKVGNTDEDVDSTQIYLPKDISESQKNTILDDLKKDFGDISIGEQTVEEEKSVRLIIIE